MTATSHTARRARILTVAASCVLAGAGGAAAAPVLPVADAVVVPADPTLGGDTIVAVATGQAVPRPSDRRDNGAIVAAVTRARALAIPRALINAQVQAATIAAATGLTLGPVTQVSQDSQAGLYFFPYNQLLSNLGPNRYCGPSTRRIVRRVNGTRTILRRTSRECYVPPYVTTTLKVTFSATRP